MKTNDRRSKKSHSKAIETHSKAAGSHPFRPKPCLFSPPADSRERFLKLVTSPAIEFNATTPNELALLETLSRQENRFDRQYHRAADRLARLKAKKTERSRRFNENKGQSQ